MLDTSAVPKAMRELLLLDANLAGLISLYNGAPAVFCGIAPERAELPLVLVGAAVSELPFDTKNSRGRIVTREVLAVSPLDHDEETIDRIAGRVQELLHKGRFNVIGQQVVDVRVVDGPRSTEIEGAIGRVMQVRITLQEATT